jgi:glycosyltransferase involved in cell wall biosynthesis
MREAAIRVADAFRRGPISHRMWRMDGAPRFSIVLPTHNRADVAPFAIRSALWQTVPDFELLVAGDGCTDKTAEVVTAFGDPRIRWFDYPKALGVGYANRNRALREARGEYVAYLAHDDLWFPDHLEQLGRVLDDTCAEFAYSRGLGVGVDGRITPYWYNLHVAQHQAGLWRGESAISLCTVVHRRSCIAKYGEWDEQLPRAGDIELWHRIVAGAEFRNLAFLPEPTALHFVANWRDTRRLRARTRVAGWAVNGWIDRFAPDALRIPTQPGRPQQAAAWDRLSRDPSREVREIRRAVTAFQDALLWRARTPLGMAGLRLGLALGGLMEGCARGAQWLASAERRRVFAALRGRTAPRRPR